MLLMSLGAQNVTVGCSKQERLALLKFKHSVLDEFGMLSSWVGNDCCNWKRVQSDDATEVFWSQGGILFSKFKTSEVPCGLVGGIAMVIVALKRIPQYTILQSELSLQVKWFASINDVYVRPVLLLDWLLGATICGLSVSFAVHVQACGDRLFASVCKFANEVLVRTPDNMAWVSGLSPVKRLDLSGVDLSGAQSLHMVFYMIPSLIELRVRLFRGCGIGLGT
ncbi:leucine-rich repeat protein [Tanacetum coccineum]|uniref:Leucine-rich repeat protein n=1 Tax=Tanacetum coccineum TaxID=301880 RepID=A0ABQ5DL09_9ASTR